MKEGKEKNNFLLALGTLSGTIMGVGFFSLPYIVSKVGIFIIFLYFLFLSPVVILIHLLFGEICLSTKEKHRFPGYAREYLGKIGGNIAFFETILGFFGALICYLIVGGSFLYFLLSPLLGGSLVFYTLIFFILGAILIFFGIKFISKAELFFLFLFFLVLFLLYKEGLSFLKIENLLNFEKEYLFLPFGTILFSLWGVALIPEIKEMIGENKKKFKKVIFYSILISTIVYFLFIFLIVGICGKNTSKEAISGLRNILKNGIISLAFSFGILTCFTSFITLGLTLKKVLWYDLKVPKNLSFILTCFPSLIIYLSGAKNFVKIISFLGGVFLGIEGILIILMYKATSQKKKLSLISLFLITIFLFGIISEIIFTLK